VASLLAFLALSILYAVPGQVSQPAYKAATFQIHPMLSHVIKVAFLWITTIGLFIPLTQALCTSGTVPGDTIMATISSQPTHTIIKIIT